MLGARAPSAQWFSRSTSTSINILKLEDMLPALNQFAAAFTPSPPSVPKAFESKGIILICFDAAESQTPLPLVCFRPHADVDIDTSCPILQEDCASHLGVVCTRDIAVQYELRIFGKIPGVGVQVVPLMQVQSTQTPTRKRCEVVLSPMQTFGFDLGTSTASISRNDTSAQTFRIPKAQRAFSPIRNIAYRASQTDNMDTPFLSIHIWQKLTLLINVLQSVGVLPNVPLVMGAIEDRQTLERYIDLLGKGLVARHCA
jgi:hypothetical protein